MENTSGTGKAAGIPPEIRGWNWGAFLLNWMWGIGNNTFIALLMFVPFVNIPMVFILGAKGNEWAWRNQQWASIEHFKSVQRKWTIGALIFYAATILLMGTMTFALYSIFKNSEVYQLAAAKVESNKKVIEVVGLPISTGFPMGNLHDSSTGGKADMAFSIEGPNGSGMVYMKAVKDLGQWNFSALILQEKESGRRFDLLE